MSMNGKQIILDGYKLPDLTKFKDFREFQASDDGPIIQVPTLRESELYHPLYGKLTFDRKFFKKLKSNFDNNTAGREIPLQAGHGSFLSDEPPAHGWVKDLKEVKTDDGKWNLFAFVQPTELGFNSIRNGDFKYASIAYTEHYFDNDDLAKIFSEEGTVDFDSVGVQKLDKGPTTLHIALTNTPFVDKQERVRMFTSPGKLDQVLILPEIEGVDWSTALSEKNATVDVDKKGTDVEDEKTKDLNQDNKDNDEKDTKLNKKDNTKPDNKQLDKSKDTGVKQLTDEEIKELRSFRDKFEKGQAELKNTEIQSASEKALSRGVAKVAVEFIKTIMDYTNRDDTLVFKMISFIEEDEKQVLSVIEHDNLYFACKKMLTDILPSNIKIKDENAITEHSQDGGEVDEDSPERKLAAKQYAGLSDPSILRDDKKKGE